MIEKKRSEILFEKNNSHSFKPKINKNSEKLIMERSRQYLEESAHNLDSSGNQTFTSARGLDKFMLLYDDAIKRKERKDYIYSKCLDSECTFHPDLVANRQFDDSRYTDPDSIVDRLAKPSKARDRSRFKYLQEEKYDKETGQPLFHPKVGRPPLAKRDTDNLPIAEKLYYDNAVRQEKKEVIKRINDFNQEKSANMKIVQEKSEELLDQKKARKFHEIFSVLDSDGDGIISAEKIDISQLSPNILEIFTPLF